MLALLQWAYYTSIYRANFAQRSDAWIESDPDYSIQSNFSFLIGLEPPALDCSGLCYDERR